MDFVDAMQAYFAGEKLTGVTLSCWGAVLLGAALFFYRTQDGGFMWGLVAVLGLLGLGALVGGAFLAWKTGPQVEALVALYRDDAAAFLAQELPRMQKVNANWVRLEAAWTVLIVGALALLWLVERDWVRGTALGVLVLATTTMVLDVFAERRALVYTNRIEALRP
jgi:hypothetical protein